MISLVNLALNVFTLYLVYKIYRAVIKDGKTALELISELSSNPFPWAKKQ
jgi:hypothetical protein